METITLEAQSRDITGSKVAAHRKQGKVPAVIYGHGVDARNLWVDSVALNRVYTAAGESTIIQLTEEGQKPVNVIIHDHQRDSLSQLWQHVDFFQVRMDEKIDADVAFDFTGSAPAVKEKGGVLVKNIEHITVTALPADLPQKLAVDLGVLATFDDRITVGNLALPENVTISVDADTVIASVTPPRTTAEIESLDEDVAADVSQIEGVQKETDDTGTAEEKEKKDQK